MVIATLTRWFMLATATSHWVFSQDYPNLLVTNKTCSVHACSQVDTAFNAIKGLATKCCSSASCYICDYADSLFKDDSPSSTKSPKDASSASTKSHRRG